MKGLFQTKREKGTCQLIRGRHTPRILSDLPGWESWGWWVDQLSVVLDAKDPVRIVSLYICICDRSRDISIHLLTWDFLPLSRVVKLEVSRTRTKGLRPLP